MSISNICCCNLRSRYWIVIESILDSISMIACCPLSSTKGIIGLSRLSSSTKDIISAWVIHSMILCLNAIRSLSFSLNTVNLSFIKWLCIRISVSCWIWLFSLFILFEAIILRSTSNYLMSHHHSIFFSLFGHMLLFSLIHTTIYHFCCCLSLVCCLVWLLSAFNLRLSLLILDRRPNFLG